MKKTVQIVSALMSIKPDYAHRIFAKTKRFEFRKKPFKRKVDRVVVYSSSPEQKVIGEFAVGSVLHGSPKTIWRKCHDFAGIDRKAFFDYFDGHTIAYAISVVKPRRYAKTRPLSDYAATPPQSYCYLGVPPR